jgi:DNA repair exonuclease SbcCD ATPase subunit
VKYKKEHIKTNGRKLTGGGPRDLQRRQQQSDIVIDHSGVIGELKNEINELSKELRERPVVNGYSGEQMDDEIRSAVTDAVKDLKKEMKHYTEREQGLATTLQEKEKEIEKIKKKYDEEIKKLLKEQTEKLEKLTESVINNQYRQGDIIVEDYESDRPQIETAFIDPLEMDAGKDLKPFLDTKDISIDEKENIYSKVDKLKGMLGKLPSKK